MTAVLRCRALQRPARAAMFRLGFSCTGQPARRARRGTSGRTLNRIPETGCGSRDRLATLVTRSTPSPGRSSDARPSSSSSTRRSTRWPAARRPAWRSRASRGSARRGCSRELRARAEERGCLVLAGAAAEFERDLPFSVWVDALDAYVASQELDLDGAGTPTLVAELGGILPSLRARRRGAAARSPTSATAATARCAALLERLAADRPLVLVLDDLHWADGASIELIAALLRRGAGAPVLFALALPPGPGARARSPPRSRRRRSRRIALDAAQRGARRPSCSATLDARGRGAIYRHGGGNPFYLEQLAAPAATARSAAARGRATAAASRPRWPPRWPRSSASLLGARARAARGGGGGRRAVRARPRGGGRRARRPPTGSTALDELLALGPGAPDGGPAPLRLPPPARAPRRLRVGAAAAGGWPPTRARPTALAARGAAAGRARPPRRAVRGPGRRGRDRACCSRPARAAAARAPAAAARWFEAALRLLPDGDRDAAGRRARGARRRRCARSASSSAAARRCSRRSTCSPPRRGDARRIELTARCAAVEHWLGRHEEAHRRLDARLGGRCPTARRPTAAALQIELAVDGLYELDFEQTLRDGPRRAGDGARASATARCSPRPRRRAVPRRGGGGRDRRGARAPRRGASRSIDRLSDAELAPRLEALYYLGWAENYLEHYDEAIAHVDRGIAIARATGEGRLLVPLMLVKGYPLEMQGRRGRGDRGLRGGAWRRRALSRQPALPASGRCSSSRWAHYYAGDLERGDRGLRGERAGRRAAGRRHDARRAAAGPGWVARRCAHFEAGDVERALRDDARARRRRPAAQDPRRAVLRLGDPGARRARARATVEARRRATSRRAEEHAAAARPRAAGGAGAARARGGAARRRATRRGRPRWPAESAVADRRHRRAARRPRFARGLQGRALAAAGERARGDRRAAPRRGASSTPAARCACATRCAASCASSARAPSRAGPATGGGQRRRRADQARARDRRAGHRPPDQPRDRRRRCS